MSEPVFTTDWSFSISYWPDMFKALELTGQPHLRFLEIGCFEGRTTLWLLENVLTHPTSWITVIDTFEGNAEFEEQGIDGDSFSRFESNVREHESQVIAIPGRSQDVLRGDPIDSADWPDEYFDFVYVDGSHEAADVLADAVLSWPFLKHAGAMCFDDYRWGSGGPDHARPGPAIDAFVRCYAPQLSGGPQGHDQYVVIKK